MAGTLASDAQASIRRMQEDPMGWSKWVRQIHRWVSIAFTVAVIIVTIIVVGGVESAEWVYLLPLLPLFILLFTGLNLFVQPYSSKWRSGRSRE